MGTAEPGVTRSPELQQMKSALLKRGFRLAEVRPLTIGGSFKAHLFVDRTCPDTPLALLPLSNSTEGVGLLDRAVDDPHAETFFLFQGRRHDAYPTLAVLGDRVIGGLSDLILASESSAAAPVAVLISSHCASHRRIDWSAM